LSEEARSHLSRIFRVLSTPERIRGLELIKEGRSLEEISRLVRMSRTGFQRVLDDFQSLELVEPAGHRSYRRLSTKGEKILDLVKDFEEKLEPIGREVVLEKFRNVIFDSRLTKEDILKIIEEVRK